MSENPEPTEAQAAPSLPRRAIFSLVALAIVLSLGYWQWPRLQGVIAARDGEPTEAKPEEPKAPVQIAEAASRDFPLYLDGVGSAQAWNSVTIRSRVDGQIDKVAFEEGQTVHKGDLLVQLDPRPFQAALDQALSKQALDRALLENTKRDLDRYTKVGRLAITQQQIDTQRALVSQQEAQLKGDQASIDNARVQLGYTTIKAPMDGRLGFRSVDVGNIVHAGDAGGITTIAEIQPIAVVFTAPEEQIPRLTKALKAAPMTVIARTSDGKTELGRGTVALIDNQVDTMTGTIRLKGRFENPDYALWPGLSVSTRLLVETEKDVVVAPDIAVQRGPNGPFAYVVTDDGKAEMRPLEVGAIQDGQAVIRKGVTAGERVVTAGHYRLQPGAPVEITNPPEKKNIAREGVEKPAAVGME